VHLSATRVLFQAKGENSLSTDATNASVSEVLPKRVASVHSDARQLMEALAQVRRTRQVLLLALVVFVCITCFAFYRLATRFQQKEQLDLLVRKAQERFAANTDQYMRDVQGLVDHSAPVVSKAFYDQAKKDLPAFLQASQAERDKLVEDLQQKLSKRITQHHEQLLSRHQKLLREEFPAVEDEKLHEAMMANLQVAVDAMVQKYYIEELKNEMLVLYGSWDEFPPVPPAGKDDLPLGDQLIGNLLELMKIKLAETSSPALAATPSGTAPPATP
jgi:hypothetical protein